MSQNDFKDKEDNIITIDLLALFHALWKWAWLIVTITLFTGSAAYMGTKLLATPAYRTQFTAYINNRNASTSTDISSILSSSDLMASKSLANTYAEILTSRGLLVEAAEEAEGEYTYDQISSAVTTQVQNDTEIITVSVTLPDADAAVDIALALEKISPDYIGEIVEGSSMKIIDSSIMPTSFVSPSYLKIALLCGVLAAVIVCMVIIINTIFDDTIESEEKLAERFNVTIIGIIPDFAIVEKKKDRYDYGYGRK